MEKIFNVEGMHCRSCEMLIKDSLEERDGVIHAEASEQNNQIKVKFDESKISESKIKSIIRNEGYKVK